MSEPDPVDVRRLSVRLGGRAVLDGIDLVLARGRVTGLVGPNGGGKTTLLRAMFRGVRIASGAVLVDGGADLRGRSLARRIAAVVQEPGQPIGVSVAETIEIGRFPHRGDLGRLDERDREVVAAAASTTDVTHLLDRELGELSGGERQRVHVARAIAQDTPVLLLDEPTNHLDIRHQFALMATLRGLAGRGVTVGLAIHDLALAARYCDVVAVVDAGRLVAYGAPHDVLRGRVAEEVFGVATGVDDAGRLVVDPL